MFEYGDVDTRSARARAAGVWRRHSRQAAGAGRACGGVLAGEDRGGYATDTEGGAWDEARAQDRDAPGGESWDDARQGRSPAVVALADLVEAIDRLAAADLAAESVEDLGAVVIGAHQQLSRLDAVAVTSLGVAQARMVHVEDGSSSMAAWLRGRWRCDPQTATARLNAAWRLADLPELAGQFTAGQVTGAHVLAITSPARTPVRLAQITAHAETLCELAAVSEPRHLRRAVGRIRDLVDADGTDVGPLDDTGPDERRFFDIRPTADGMVDIRGRLDVLTGEKLMVAIDAASTPDPPDAPARLRRRSATQRRHDAFDAVLDAVLAAGDLPSTGGVKPHIIAAIDLATLAGNDAEATRSPRLRHAGPIPPAVARRLARQAKITALQTMGPWRAVAVGSAHRTLPAWLRPVLDVVHGRCRGPDCDRPISWADAHHEHDWATHHDTDANATIPLCRYHHQLVTTGGWTVTFDPDSGACDWTSPTGTTHTTWPTPLHPW